MPHEWKLLESKIFETYDNSYGIKFSRIKNGIPLDSGKKSDVWICKICNSIFLTKIGEKPPTKENDAFSESNNIYDSLILPPNCDSIIVKKITNQ